MPTDQEAAIAHARANYRYLAEARCYADLDRLKMGADGYNQSLHIAKVIDDEQLRRLTSELDEACEVQRRHLNQG